jgi:hypothetical protein
VRVSINFQFTLQADLSLHFKDINRHIHKHTQTHTLTETHIQKNNKEKIMFTHSNVCYIQ